jgi:hypothetical protein
MTLHDLRLLWAQRDHRYGLRRQALSPAETAVVRTHRQAEADALPRPVRRAAHEEAGRWLPPPRTRRILP